MIPGARLTRVCEQRVQGRWRGRDVSVWNRPPDGRVVLRSGDSGVAARLSMEGDQGMLWSTFGT